MLLLLPIGVTLITSPFVYKIYRNMHFSGLVKESKKDLRKKEVEKYTEWFSKGIITEEEYVEKLRGLFGFN